MLLSPRDPGFLELLGLRLPWRPGLWYTEVLRIPPVTSTLQAAMKERRKKSKEPMAHSYLERLFQSLVQSVIT